MPTPMIQRLHLWCAALSLGLLGPPLSPAKPPAVQSLNHVKSLYVNYTERPPAEDLLKHELCILDAFAVADLKPAQQRGHCVLAYISLVELAADSPFAAQAQVRGVPQVGRNEAWGTALLDVSSPAWRKFILDDCAKAVMARGFDGFFLDTADSIERLPTTSPAQAQAYCTALIEVVRALAKRWPSQRIVINRGFNIIPALTPVLSGVLIESVCQSFDPISKKYRAVRGQDREWILARLREVQALRLPVFAIDYVKPEDKTLANETAAKLRDLGCVPLVTTPELSGTVIAN